MKVNSVILFALFFVFGCRTDSNNEDKPVITASILPQRYLLQKVAGSRFEINIMIPPGASPATYDPSPRQLQQLSKSKAYFMTGNLGFENAWIKKITSFNKSMPVFNLSSGIELIYSEHHNINKDNKSINADPHIWMSPKEIKIICRNIYMALKEIIPSDSLIYKYNYYSFLEELDSLDREIKKSLSKLNKRKFFIYHPALTYYARDYELIQISVEHEGKAPSPYHLKQLINLAEKENIKTIFIQEQFDIENAEVLAHEIEGKIIKINPLDEDLLNQIIYITAQLKKNISNTQY
jgi:zinc transport system substrate-binding protein